MSVVKRLKMYLDLQGVTNQKYEKSVGYSNGAYSSQLRNDGNISSDKLEKTLIVYNDINGHWLLTGSGPMLKSEKLLNNTKKETLELKAVLFEDENVINKKLDVIINQNSKILEQFTKGILKDLTKKEREAIEKLLNV